MKYYFKYKDSNASIETTYLIDFNNKNQIEITIDYGFGPGVSFCLFRNRDDDKISWGLNDKLLPYNIPQELKNFIDGIIRLPAFA